MNRLLFCITVLLFVSSSPHPDEACYVYGKIVDGATGERLKGVQVSLVQNGVVVTSVMTDSGEFGFNVSQSGVYKIEARKNEYNIYEDAVVNISSGIGTMRRDIMLEKPPRFLQIRKNGVEIETLGLGKVKNTDTYVVDLFNSGNETMRFVTEKNRRWIVSVTPPADVIEPEETASIAIRIDPALFEAGRTAGQVLVMSDNGCKALTIKAEGNFPVVEVMPITELFPDAFEGRIVFEGDHTYGDRGFCFSTTNTCPTIQDKRVSANDLGGQFIYRDIWDDDGQFPWLGNRDWADEVCQKWYVRAYLKYENENDTVIYSNNVESFVLWEIFCPTCP